MFNFYVGVDPISGRKKRTTRRGFKTKREAKLALAQLRLGVNEDGAGSINEMTFEEVYDLWMQQHKLEVKITTYKAIKSKFERILPKFGHLKIASIDSLYCQSVINEWATELKTFNDYKIQANLVFKYALKYDLITRNPMEHVTMPRLKNEQIYDEDDELVNFFTKEELKNFLSKAKQDMELKDFALFRLLAFTGLRKGEALALHWNDIDFERQMLIVRKTLAYNDGKHILQPPKTINSRRRVDIDDISFKTLNEWKQQQQNDFEQLGLDMKTKKSPLFTRFDPIAGVMKYFRLAKPNDTLNRLFNKHPELPKITVHGLRHTHASLLFEAGTDLKAAQARLGHTDIQTTMDIYTHVTDKTHKETANKFKVYVDF